MHPHGGGAFVQQQYDMSAGGSGGVGMPAGSMYDQHGYGMPPLQQKSSQQGQGGGGRGVEGVSSGRGSAASASPQQTSTPSPGSQHLQSPSYEPHHHMGAGYGRMANGGAGGGNQGYGSGYDSYSQNVGDSDVYGDMSGPGSGEDLAQVADEYVDGAVHLSAGAKPFVPKFGTSPGMPLPAVSSDLNISSSDLHMGALSLPPMSEASSSWTLDTSSQGGLPVSWQQQGTSGGNSLLGASGVTGDDDDDYHAGMDSIMHLHVPLDILSFDGIGDSMGESGDDLGESLLGRLAGGGGADRRRNRGMLFESSSLSTSSRYLNPSSTAGDDDDAILNHLISDVITSPNDNPSLSFPSPGASLFPGES